MSQDYTCAEGDCSPKSCESPHSTPVQKEIINTVSKIIKKYRDNQEYLQELSGLVSQIEEQLVSRVEQRQRIQEKQDLCQTYLQQFIDQHGDDYWYHPYTQNIINKNHPGFIIYLKTDYNQLYQVCFRTHISSIVMKY